MEIAPSTEDVGIAEEPHESVVENRYANQPNATMKDQNDVYSPELLGMYYSRLFPYHFLYSWLSYDPSDENSSLFSRREFSFTIEPKPGEEIYIRYQSFSSEAELSSAILKRRPTKIDIGAIFSHAPKDHNSVQGKFKTQQRELVFDIDLTDYDEVRNCGCSGAKICPRCWEFMKMAVKVMDQGLREDFGFKQIAWFYSGRRGVHAWICDQKARTLSNEARSSVASYFEVNLGSTKNKTIGLAYPLHPTLARCYSILEPLFVRHVLPASGHGLMATQKSWEDLLDKLPDSATSVKENLKAKWAEKPQDTNPEEKWDTLKQHLRAFTKKDDGKSKKKVSTSDNVKIEMFPIEVVFRYTYPRLDVNVSKMQNHLLKSPFCVHPKTGRVCVPISAERVDEFDPFSVPSLGQLMKELDEFEASEEHITHEWQKTSLKEPFEHFQTHVLEPMQKGLRRAQRDAVERTASISGDF